MENYKTETEKFKNTKEVSLNYFTRANLIEIAFELINYEIVRKGTAIKGWKYLKKHDLAEGPCLYNGDKIITLNGDSCAKFLLNKYPELEDEYLNKVTQQIQDGTYDREFMANFVSLDLCDKANCLFKSIFNKK